VYLEPGITHTVSAKFKDLPMGEALHRLLGDVNFAYIPETNQPSRLMVYRTTRQSATQKVKGAERPAPKVAKANFIKNELIVRLKPGMKIEDIAKMLGAKVIGKIDGLNAYRLQFDSEAAAD